MESMSLTSITALINRRLVPTSRHPLMLTDAWKVIMQSGCIEDCS